MRTLLAIITSLLLAQSQASEFSWIQKPTISRSSDEIFALWEQAPKATEWSGNGEAPLVWLRHHQSPDGSWSGPDHPVHCTLDGQRSEPDHGGGGWNLSEQERTLFLTGTAANVYMGFGYDHKMANPHRITVKNAIEYIKEQALLDPPFGTKHPQAVIPATMALTESYAMTMDTDLKEAANRAMAHLYSLGLKTHKASAEDDPIGWPEKPGELTVDLRTTWLAVRTLASYRMEPTGRYYNSGQFRDWLIKMIQISQKQFPGDVVPLPSKATPGLTQFRGEGTAFGLALGVYLGLSGGDPEMVAVSNRTMELAAQPSNDIFAQVATNEGLYQTGGEPWKTYYPSQIDSIQASLSTTTGCLAGSYEPIFTNPETIGGGRLISTVTTAQSILPCLRYHLFVHERKQKDKETVTIPQD